MVICLSFSQAAFAEVIYTQAPEYINQNIALECNDYPPGVQPMEQRIADDFILESDAEISSVSWTGFYTVSAPIEMESILFSIEFYATDTLGKPEANSVPGREVDVVEANLTEAGMGNNGYMNYDFTAVLNSTFEVAANELMWLSVVEVDTATDDVFKWSGTSGDNVDICSRFVPDLHWYFAPFVPGRAFELSDTTIVPEPASIIMVCLGCCVAMLPRRRSHA